MKTFTFYEDKETVSTERCSYSVQANSIEEATKIMLNAIKNSNECDYSNEDWELIDYNTDIVGQAFYNEDNEQIW